MNRGIVVITQQIVVVDIELRWSRSRRMRRGASVIQPIIQFVENRILFISHEWFFFFKLYIIVSW